MHAPNRRALIEVQASSFLWAVPRLALKRLKQVPPEP